MSQEDFIISDQTGVSFLSDLNSTLAAIVSNNSGATAPSTTYPYMLWSDTTSGLLKQRNAANTAWINILTLSGIKSADIRNTPAGSITATNVQAALAELDTEKAALEGSDFTGQIKSTAGDLNLVTNTALSDATATLTASQLLGGEFTITPTAARILTADTATNIISALSGSVDNSNFEFTVINLASFDVTIALGAGVTLVGSMVVNDGSATFRVRRLTSSTISVTRMETGSGGVGGISLQSVATTSGTSVDITGIPAGVKRITLTGNQISTNGASNILLQLGDSGGVETSGYESTVVDGPFSSNYTVGFGLSASVAAGNTRTGIVTLMLSETNTWNIFGGFGRTDSDKFSVTQGLKSLSGTIDRVRLTMVNGADVFDAGSIRISWEF